MFLMTFLKCKINWLHQTYHLIWLDLPSYVGLEWLRLEQTTNGVKYPICPVCKIDTEYDSQYHLMVCTRLNENVVTSHTSPEYDDLFKPDLDKKMAVVKVLKENFQKRKEFLKNLQK